MKNQKWYKANAGNDQGLIVSENDGRNIAVSYDIKDADLIASAPELLAAAKSLLAEEKHLTIGTSYLEYRALEAAISKAEGN